MQIAAVLLAALFLPLFPLGMVFNAVFLRARHVWLRSLLLIAWPLAGLAILQSTDTAIPEWFAAWGLFSAALYGFRAVVIREVGLWTGFFATSAWPLVWVALVVGIEVDALVIQVLAFSLPLVLLVFLTAEIERRYESAYAGIVRGIAQAQPRLAGVIVLTLLAVIGTPLFPAFFALLNNITHVAAVMPAAASGIAVVWWLWSWSGMRLLQQLLVGPGAATRHEDILPGMTLAYTISLLMLLFVGIYVSETML